MRLIIEIEDGAAMTGEIEDAIESGEAIGVEMPGWGSAFNATIVGVAAPEPVPSPWVEDW